MPTCEKCWAEYKRRRDWGGQDITYEQVLKENEGKCTPEQQCGEMHLVVSWKDGTRHCVCGKVREEGSDGA